jgi:hypothetical protein
MIDMCPHCNKVIGERKVLGEKQARMISMMRDGVRGNDLRKALWSGDMRKASWSMRRMISVLREKGYRIEQRGRGIAASYHLIEKETR